ETDRRPGPRRLRRVLQLGRCDRPAARGGSPRHRRRQPAAQRRHRRGRCHGPGARRGGPGAPRGALLRRHRHHQRRPQRRRDHRARLRVRLRTRRGRELRDPVRARPGRHARRDPVDRRARGWEDRPVHRAGPLPPAVRRGRPRRGGRPHGGHPAPGDRCRSQRPLRARPALEGHPELVRLRRARPQHPRRRARVHGGASRLPQDRGGRGSRARAAGLAPRRGGPDDPRGREGHRARLRL
ncbi:MAG: Mlr6684 protein, partial [uncultured Pseudonocardia sp.]